jgi:hypothetical protein
MEKLGKNICKKYQNVSQIINAKYHRSSAKITKNGKK